MKKNILGLALLSALPLAAQDAPKPAAESGSRHSFGVQGATWHRARAAFRGGRVSNPGPILANPTANATTIDRFYDNGFVRVNALGNPISPDIHRTSFYGFTSNDQVTPPDFTQTPPGAGSIAFHSASVDGGGFAKPFSNDLSPALELFYRYSAIEKERWSLSLEAGFSWMHLDWDQNGTFGARADIIEDRYSTGTVDARSVQLPYTQGVFDPAAAPGPVTFIGSNPVRQAPYSAAASVTTRRDVSAESLIVRLGPSLDWKVCKHFDLSVLAGPAFGWSSTAFSFADSISVAHPAIPAYQQSGSGSSDSFRVGLYSAVRGTVHLTENWSALVEGRHLWMEDLRANGAGRSVNVSVSEGFGISVGIMKTF